MTFIVASEASDSTVTAVAEAFAERFSTTLAYVRPSDDWQGDVLRNLTNNDVTLAVMATDEPRLSVWAVAEAARKPLLLVPRSTQRRTIARVLVPLDGSAETAAAALAPLNWLSRAGLDIVLLHVFDPKNVPMHWDQASHALASWESEFLARHGRDQLAHVTLRTGVAGEHIVQVAKSENIDVIVLLWSRRISAGHARTVRQTVTESDIPILLIPMTAD